MRRGGFGGGRSGFGGPGLGRSGPMGGGGLGRRAPMTGGMPRHRPGPRYGGGMNPRFGGRPPVVVRPVPVVVGRRPFWRPRFGRGLFGRRHMAAPAVVVLPRRRFCGLF